MLCFKRTTVYQQRHTRLTQERGILVHDAAVYADKLVLSMLAQHGEVLFRNPELEEFIKRERGGSFDRCRRREPTCQRDISCKRAPERWDFIALLFRCPDDTARVVCPRPLALAKELAFLLKVGGVELRITMSYRQGNATVYCAGQDESAIVISMLADQVDSPRGAGNQGRLFPKLFLICLNGTLLSLPHQYLLYME